MNNDKYIVVFIDDMDDLYHEEFETLDQARKYIEKEIEENKAVIIKGEFLEYYT